MSAATPLQAYVQVCRMEYLRLEGPGGFAPLFLAATSLEELVSVPILLAYVAFMMWFFGGFMANSLADVEVDRLFKKHIAHAVDVLGRRTLVVLVVSHTALGLAIAWYLGHAFDDASVFWWVLVAMFFGLAYSLQPFHFKVKGPMYFSLQIGSFVMVSLVYYVVGGMPPPPVLFIFAAFIVAHQGIELVNQAQDFLVDTECELRTPGVRWGVHATLVAAMVTTVIGLALGMAGFFVLYEDLVPLSLFGVRIEPMVLFVVTVLSLLAGYALPLLGTRAFLRLSARIRAPEHVVPIIQKHLDYPKWQMTAVLGTVLPTALYFAWRLATS